MMDDWGLHTIDTYEPLKDSEGWKECPMCGSLPRVWIFDNGRFAKCRCAEKYGPAMARAESIMSYHRRRGDTIGHDSFGLRTAWNEWVDTGIIQGIPEGQW